MINKLKDNLSVVMGASGLASVIIPMAKAFGVRVITTVLSDEIAANIKHLGADIKVDHDRSPCRHSDGNWFKEYMAKGSNRRSEAYHL